MMFAMLMIGNEDGQIAGYSIGFVDGKERGRLLTSIEAQACYAKRYTIGQCAIEYRWPGFTADLPKPPAPAGDRSDAGAPEISPEE